MLRLVPLFSPCFHLPIPPVFPPLLPQYHKLIYAEDVLTLNEANRDTSEITPGVPRLYGIAKPAGTQSVLFRKNFYILYICIYVCAVYSAVSYFP